MVADLTEMNYRTTLHWKKAAGLTMVETWKPGRPRRSCEIGKTRKMGRGEKSRTLRLDNAGSSGPIK